jgi:Fe2+ or Zn2+ uptake regulation protein
MTQAEFIAQAEAVIAAEGGRMTAARRIILNVIAGSHAHLTADDIYARARRQDRSINPSTVYRTLAVLKRHNLIAAHYDDQDSHREIFEPKPSSEHYHFTCSQCGAVIEFESRHVLALQQQLADEFGAEVTRACLCLTGVCATCQSSAADS